MLTRLILSSYSKSHEFQARAFIVGLLNHLYNLLRKVSRKGEYGDVKRFGSYSLAECLTYTNRDCWHGFDYRLVYGDKHRIITLLLFKRTLLLVRFKEVM